MGFGEGWGSGKSGVWVKVFQYNTSFEKNKFMPVNSHNDPNLTMHWHREMENVAGRVLFRVKVLVRVLFMVLVRVRVLVLLKLGFC